MFIIQSEQINEIATALCKAQAEMETATKDKKNSFFKSKYADLPSVWEACRPALNKNGLCISHAETYIDGKEYLITQLSHGSSGQWMRSCGKLINEKGTAQGQVAAVTYGRRSGIGCVTGVVCEEDDDGEGCTKRPSTEKSITKDQGIELAKLAAQCDPERIKNMQRYFEIEAWGSLPATQFEEASEMLWKMIKGKKAA